MTPSNRYGRVMMRGDEQFEVETDPAFFTVILENDADEGRVHSLLSPKSSRKMGRLLKVQVDPADRDAAMARLRSRDVNLVCHHAYRLPGRQGTRYYLTDLLIVRVLPRLGDPRAFFDHHGLEVYCTCDGIPGTYAVRVIDAAGKNPLKVAHDLIQQSGVVYAEPNLMERYTLSTPAAEPGPANRQWHLDQISARQAWTYTRGIREIVIAVVDDGCDLSHPAFSGAGKVVYPKDFVDGDTRPWSEYPNVESGRHGTACAGLAAAGEDPAGVTGVAPGCALMPVRMTAIDRMEVETLNVRDMFEFVGRHADVISCSWSSVPCYSPMPQPIAEVFDKIATSGGPRGRGTVLCFAAGNHNAPIRDDDNHHFEYKTYPKSTKVRVAQTKILNGFAAHPYVMAVAATTSNDQKACYSNWGKEISVCAPSDNYDPLTGQRLSGKALFTTDNEAHGPGYVPGSRFTDFSGTSGACPLVAGVAGLVRSAQPRLRALQVKAILEETADPVVAAHTDVDEDRIRAAYIAGHSAWFGYGRINAKKAVEKALLFQ